MTNERENEFVEKCEGVVDEYINAKLYEWLCPAEDILRGAVKAANYEELKETLKLANNAIRLACRGNRVLYREFCYRAFKTGDGSVYLSRGKEIKDIHDQK